MFTVQCAMDGGQWTVTVDCGLVITSVIAGAPPILPSRDGSDAPRGEFSDWWASAARGQAVKERGAHHGSHCQQIGSALAAGRVHRPNPPQSPLHHNLLQSTPFEFFSAHSISLVQVAVLSATPISYPPYKSQNRHRHERSHQFEW